MATNIQEFNLYHFKQSLLPLEQAVTSKQQSQSRLRELTQALNNIQCGLDTLQSKDFVRGKR